LVITRCAIKHFCGSLFIRAGCVHICRLRTIAAELSTINEKFSCLATGLGNSVRRKRFASLAGAAVLVTTRSQSAREPPWLLQIPMRIVRNFDISI
jgi:hypothetical protein